MSEDYSQLDFVDVNDVEAAENRFEEFSSKDPLPDIPPALLNMGDIYDYARITSMVFPFNKNNVKDKLKPASYEIDFLGDIYQINEKTGEIEKGTIKYNNPFILKKNSIVFLFTKTKFFLPDYIAIRFNLRITHVHRGLLLGTGPLIDPGFVGRLLIPLHNLTSEDYTLYGGDGLIWVEFTKLSPHKKWNPSARETNAEYVSFSPDKRDLSAQLYFKKASPKGKPANSSIPGEVKKTRNDVKTIKNLTIGGGILALISILSIVLPTVSLIKDAFEMLDKTRNLETRIQEELNNSKQKIEFLEEKIKSLTKLLEQANKEKSVNVHKKNSSK